MTADGGDARGSALGSLLPIATAVVPVAVLVSLPMAFGIVMSGDDFPDAHNLYLYGLIGLVLVAVGSLIGAWTFAPRMVNGSRRVVPNRFAACALAAGGLIVATFSAEVLSVVLGF